MTRRMVLLVVLALMLTSCGEQAEDTAATPGGDLQAYCDAVVNVETLTGAPDEDVGEEIKAWNRDTLLPAFEDVAAAAPDEVKDHIAAQLDGIEVMAETGDLPPREMEAARIRRMAFDHANCDWQTVDVTVTEYEYGGIPATLKTGATSFRFKNTGEEPHELVFRGIHKEVTEPFAEMMEDGEVEEVRGKTIEALGGTFAEPGGTQYVVLELEEGRHGVFCPIPAGKDGRENHWHRGELAEFTVE